MKLLNEKTIASLPTAHKTDKEGFLYKRGVEYNNSFKRRYFVLLCNLLYYYEKQGDKEPIGVIILERHTVELFDDADRANCFIIRFPDDCQRSFVLSSDKPSELNPWMRAIVSAGIEFTRITLEELEAQQQRDTFEIPEMPEVTPLSSMSVTDGAPVRVNPFDDGSTSGFRVTVHFPTFLHFHEAIEQALCPEPEPEPEQTSIRKSLLVESDGDDVNLIEF